MRTYYAEIATTTPLFIAPPAQLACLWNLGTQSVPPDNLSVRLCETGALTLNAPASDLTCRSLIVLQGTRALQHNLRLEGQTMPVTITADCPSRLTENCPCHHSFNALGVHSIQ